MKSEPSQNINKLLLTSLKTSLLRKGLSNKEIYGEEEIRPALMLFLESIESLASNICKPFNSFGLLCALQHLIPSSVKNTTQEYDPDNQIIFNHASALAFRFSSSTKDAKVIFRPTDYRKSVSTGDRNWLDQYSVVVVQIYFIVQSIQWIISTLRCLGKGAKAKINLNSAHLFQMLVVNKSNSLSRRLIEYDRRLINNQSVFIPHGFPGGIPEEESPLRGIVAYLNWAEYRKGNTDPPPVAKIINLEAIYGITHLHDEEVRRIFKNRVHVEDFFVFLATLLEPTVEKVINNERLPGMGYDFTNENNILDYVATVAPRKYAECYNAVFREFYPDTIILECFTSAYWREVSPQLLLYCSHDFETRHIIDITLFRPAKFIYRCDDGTIFIHLGSVIHFFIHLWDGFRSTGQFKNNKGKLFEDLLLNILESVEGFKRIWEPSHKLKFPVGGKTSTDVDVFVQRKNLAFLISCKSYSTNRKYEMGEGQACWERSELAKSWLHFAKQTAREIVKHKQSLHLPDRIKGIYPLVCTGWPEYIFKPLKNCFMVDGTPRIATMMEIKYFFENLDDDAANRLLNDRWTVSI